MVAPAWVVQHPHSAREQDATNRAHGIFVDIVQSRSGQRRVVLREVLNAVFYILGTGCQWRALPKDLPPRSTVHDYFVRWQCDGTLSRLHHALYEQARELAGKEASPTTAIVDSQSVKGAERGGARSIRWAMMQPRRSKGASATPSLTRSA
jgi:transposase